MDDECLGCYGAGCKHCESEYAPAFSESSLTEIDAIPQIFITLLIDDKETVSAYKGCHPDIIMDDLRNGSLIEKCSMVDVVAEE